MGKKSKSTNDPSAFAKPYITSGADAVQSAFQANQPNIANISSLLQKNMPGVSDSLLHDPGLTAAGSYNTAVLGGKYLNGNPNLQGVIDSTNSDVANKVNASIGSRGGAGGSGQAAILARELAKNETGLRYQDYATERGYQDHAVGNATALSGANDSNLQTLLGYLSGQAEIPQAGANSYAASIGGLMSPYQTKTSQDSGFNNWLKLVSAATGAAKAAGMGG